MHLVSQSAQVRNPSSSKDEAALQKDEELLLTVESNSQLARALSPFLGPLASRKNKGVFITLPFLIPYQDTHKYLRGRHWKSWTMMLVMFALRSKEISSFTRGLFWQGPSSLPLAVGLFDFCIYFVFNEHL